MSKSIHSLLPDSENLLSLEPEELAGYLMEYLNSLPDDEKKHLNRSNFGGNHTVQEYPPEYQAEILKALIEAWGWLERKGLIAPKPGDRHGWVFITSDGQKFKNHGDIDAFRKANLLPKKLLHPVIALKVWSDFLRGEYEDAIFKAFKEVEIAVREAGGFSHSDIGINLMRKAFDPDKGPLTDLSQESGEKESLSHLFAGAIGYCKNPRSHREVPIDEVTEAVELIFFASYLLRIVDERKPN